MGTTKAVFTCFMPVGCVSVNIDGIDYDYYLDGALVKSIQHQSTKSPLGALNALKKASVAYVTGGYYYDGKDSGDG